MTKQPAKTAKKAPAEPKLSPIEDLIGKKLLKDAKGTMGSTNDLFKDKSLVALYFSASWCPPCQSFTPKLIDFYNKYASKEGVEIVYLSSDTSKEEYETYYGKMPWLSLPNDDKESLLVKNWLVSQLKIQGIPTLVIFDVKTGLFISNNARNDVMIAGTDENKCKELLNKWKTTKPVTIEEGLQMDLSFDGVWNTFIQMILKNPMYLVGVFYMIRWCYRKYNTMKGGVDDTIGDDTTVPSLDNEPIPDTEF